MNTIDLKRARWAAGAKWALAAGAVLVVSPIVFLLVKGLVGLIVAGVLGMAIVNFAPVLAMKFANWKVKAIRAEAAANPVETLLNVFHQRERALGEFARSITAFRAEVAGFGDKVETFAAQFPQDAEKFRAQLAGMKRVLEVRETRYRQAKKELEVFDKEIARANAIWQMSQAAQRLNLAAGLDTGDVYERIKTETAVESVQASLNKAFSDLETALLDEPQQPLVIPVNATVKEIA